MRLPFMTLSPQRQSLTNDICTFATGNVQIELADSQLAGRTHWEADDPAGRHQVADTVDPARFFAQYFSVFN